MQSKYKKGDRVRVVRGAEPFPEKPILMKPGEVVGRVGKGNFLIVELEDGFSFGTKEGYLERLADENTK